MFNPLLVVPAIIAGFVQFTADEPAIEIALENVNGLVVVAPAAGAVIVPVPDVAPPIANTAPAGVADAANVRVGAV